MPRDLERRAQARTCPPAAIYVDYPDLRPRIRDLNLWGAYVLDPRPLPTGHIYQMRFWLDEKTCVTARAMVRRCVEGSGIAVEFVEMCENDRNALRHFLGTTEMTPSPEPL